jgi:hypothetical protein
MFEHDYLSVFVTTSVAKVIGRTGMKAQLAKDIAFYASQEAGQLKKRVTRDEMPFKNSNI